MQVTLNELREIKQSLSNESIARIAKELNVDEQAVRYYFGIKKFRGGQFSSSQILPDLESGLTRIEDTRIIDLAKKIINENNMTAITIQVSNEVAETVGVEELEKQINDLIAKVALKLAAKEMLRDLKAINLSKDPEWAKARAAAWEQEKANVLKKLNKQLND